MSETPTQLAEESPPAGGKTAATPTAERAGGSTQDQLLDEALKETFPASDPVSVYRIETVRAALESSNNYVDKNGLPLERYRQF